MDYRILLAAPLAAAAVSASSADGLRQPEGWMPMASYGWPQGPTHEAGVAPETERSGQRALTVRALGETKPHEIGSIAQYVGAGIGQRVRLSAQVKTAGVDGWAGLVVGQGFIPLPYQPGTPEYDAAPALGTAGCPEWCEVSVVADIAADGDELTRGSIIVGLAVVGQGQAWARSLRLEVVGQDVPLTTEVFAPRAAEFMEATRQQMRLMATVRQTPPKNLALR